MSRDGILFILVGPSAAGKNTLMKHVQDQLDDLPQLATATTRKIRKGEEPDREHHFVTRKKFQRLIDTNALIEYTPFHMDDWYGTPHKDVEDALNAGQDLIADIESLGASKVHAAYPDNTVLIFVTPSRLDTLAERIRQRGGLSRRAMANRLERAKFEMIFAPKCHYLILNDIVEPAVEHLRQVIMSERSRRQGQTAVLPKPVFHSAAVALIQQPGQLLVQTNANGYDLPTFPLADHERLPHEVLKESLHASLGYEARIEAISDKRFTFIAPRYVTLAAIPQDIYLYYYYKCSQPPPASISGPGWDWSSLDDLNLPAAIKKLVKS